LKYRVVNIILPYRFLTVIMVFILGGTHVNSESL